MSDFFNTTNGPVNLSLSDGSSCTIPAKGRVFIDPQLEHSASILSMISKGFITKYRVTLTEPKPLQETTAARPLTEILPVPSVQLTENAPPTSSVKEEFTRKKR